MVSFKTLKEKNAGLWIAGNKTNLYTTHTKKIEIVEQLHRCAKSSISESKLNVDESKCPQNLFAVVHKCFENYMSWYAVARHSPFPFSYYIYCSLVSCHFLFFFYVPAMPTKRQKPRAVTDHISSNLFLILGISRLEWEGEPGTAQILPIHIFQAKLCVENRLFALHFTSI